MTTMQHYTDRGSYKPCWLIAAEQSSWKRRVIPGHAEAIWRQRCQMQTSTRGSKWDASMYIERRYQYGRWGHLLTNGTTFSRLSNITCCLTLQWLVDTAAAAMNVSAVTNAVCVCLCMRITPAITNIEGLGCSRRLNKGRRPTCHFHLQQQPCGT